MHIKQLYAENFRNLASVRLDDCGRFNLIFGLNGSGKTSVLEAIYTLSMTRSFRTRQMLQVIQEEKPHLLVTGKLVDSQQANPIQLGVQRGRDKSVLVKMAGQTLKSLAELSGVLPVQVLDARCFELLEGGPAVRRQFLDWPVFHVKHMAFFDVWSRYRKALKQRNALLRRGIIGDWQQFQPWDEALAEAGEKLTVLRRDQFSAFLPLFEQVYAAFDDDGKDGQKAVPSSAIQMRLKDGWDQTEGSLREVLVKQREADAKQGFTRSGPHRADIDIRCGAYPAAQVLSRGQIKSVASAMKIAQLALLASQGLDVLIAIDDLPAELDIYRRETIFRKLAEIPRAQVFVTAIDKNDLQIEGWMDTPDSYRVFHVEHGCIESDRV